MATQTNSRNNDTVSTETTVPATEGNTAAQNAPTVPNVAKPVVPKNIGFTAPKVLTLSDLAGIREDLNKAASVAVKARSEADLLGFSTSVSCFNEHGTLTVYKKEEFNVPFFSYRAGIQDTGETVTTGEGENTKTVSKQEYGEGVLNLLADTVNAPYTVIAYKINEEKGGFCPDTENPFIHIQPCKIVGKSSALDVAIKAFNTAQNKVKGKGGQSGLYVAVIVQALETGDTIMYRSQRFRLVVKG